MAPTELVDAIFQLSTHPASHDASRLNPSLNTLRIHLGSLSGRQVSKLFVACRNLVVDEVFWAALCTRGRNCNDFRTRDISAILNTLTRPIWVAGRVAKHTDALESTLIRHLCDVAVPMAAEFDEQDISSILNALGKFGVKHEELVNALCLAASSKTFTPQGISLVLNALAKLGKNDDILIQKLCSEASSKIAEFNSQGLVNTLNALAKLRFCDEAMVAKLCSGALSKVADFNAHDIANTLNALGKFGLHNELLVRALCAEALSKLTEFNSQGIANILHALAKLGNYDEILVKWLCSEVLVKAADFTSQEIANTLSALAEFEFFDEVLVRELCTQAVSKVADFNSQGIANTLNALSKFFSLHEEALCTEAPKGADVNSDTASMLNAVEILFKSLCSEARLKISYFNSQSIANTLNALAKFGFYDEVLVKKLCTKAVWKIADFNSQDIANMLSALAKFGLFNKVLVRALCTAALSKVAEFNSHDIGNTLDALAKVGLFDEALVTALCIEARSKVSDFNSRDIVTTLHALAMFGFYDEILVKKLCSEALLRVADFNPQGIASTLGALAKFDLDEEVLVKRLCSEALLKVTGFCEQDISTTVHGLMVLQHFDSSLLESLGLALSRISGKSLPVESRANWPWQRKEPNIASDQLAACNLCLSLNGVMLQLPSTGSNQIVPVSSAFHRQVSGVLTALAVTHKSGYNINGLLVDIAIVETHVVVELDGPSHYCRGSSRMLGTTLFKHRLLRQLGWQVLNVPRSDWARLSGEQRAKYLTNLLDARVS